MHIKAFFEVFKGPRVSRPLKRTNNINKHESGETFKEHKINFSFKKVNNMVINLKKQGCVLVPEKLICGRCEAFT